MRLLRPGPRTRSISSIGAPSNAAATEAISASAVSMARVVGENGGGNVRPGRANDAIGHQVGRFRGGAEQEGGDCRRKIGIGKDFDQVVDEMRAAEGADALQLGRAVVLEVDMVAAEAEPGLVEEALV